MSKSLPSYQDLLKSYAGGFANVPLDKQELAKSHTPAQRKKRMSEIFADKKVSDDEADELEDMKEDEEMEKAIQALEVLEKAGKAKPQSALSSRSDLEDEYGPSMQKATIPMDDVETTRRFDPIHIHGNLYLHSPDSSYKHGSLRTKYQIYDHTNPNAKQSVGSLALQYKGDAKSRSLESPTFRMEADRNALGVAGMRKLGRVIADLHPELKTTAYARRVASERGPIDPPTEVAKFPANTRYQTGVHRRQDYKGPENP